MPWQLWLVATVLCWGLWGFLAGMGLRSNSWQQLLVWGIPASAAIAAVMWAVFGDEAAFGVKTLAWASAIQLAGLVGMVFFYQALRVQQASVVVPISASYPAVTAVLSVLLGRERLQPLQAVGIVLVILGTIAVSISSSNAPS